MSGQGRKPVERVIGMGYFRLFRRVRIAPGLTVNLSKSGPSLSLGVRGAHVTLGRTGIRKTIGLPGSGLFYTSKQGWHTGAHTAPQFASASTAPPFQQSGTNVAGLPGTGASQSSGAGLAVGMLALAFMAGGLVVYMLMPKLAPTPPPVTPPAAVTAPVAPVQPTPAKRRRAHSAKQATAPKVPRPSTSPVSNTPQTPPLPASHLSQTTN